MKPFQLGVTGGIGSGKSLVCKILTVLGIPVYNADEASKKLLESDPAVIVMVSNSLGSEAYQQNGKANRAYIAGIVFNNPEKLKELNAILHPAVQRNYEDWVLRHDGLPIIAKEAAILFESGSNKDMDAVIVVTAPEEIRINRVVARDGKSREEVHKIILQQLSQDEVIKRSDFVIINDGNQLVVPQVLQIIEAIKTNFR